MPRAVNGTRRTERRKKILKQAKGYWEDAVLTFAQQKMP